MTLASVMPPWLPSLSFPAYLVTHYNTPHQRKKSGLFVFTFGTRFPTTFTDCFIPTSARPAPAPPPGTASRLTQNGSPLLLPPAPPMPTPAACPADPPVAAACDATTMSQ